MYSRLERSTPEREGLSSVGLLEVMKEFSSETQFHSVMILRHGKVICEGWWRPYSYDEPHQMFSLSKSFTSTAIGMCVHEGRLSVDDKVSAYFRDLMPEETTPWLESMTIKHLLTMSSGHKDCIAWRCVAQGTANWGKAFFENPLATEPGSTFVYNSMATYMLSVLVTRLTGQKVVDYLRPRLFEPLGIEQPEWDECPMGYNTGGWGLHLRTEDIAKFGQLYLQRGIWEGRRLISESWIDMATSAQIDNSPGRVLDWAQGYGFQFWRCMPDGAYRGDGAFGQYCLVVPSHDIVVAITETAKDMQKPLTTVWDKLLPLCQDKSLAEDADGQAALWSYCKNLSIPKPEGALCMAEMERDQSVELAENVCGVPRLAVTFTEVGVSFDAEGCRLRLVKSDGGVVTMLYGRGDWRYTNENFDIANDCHRSAGVMAWEDTHHLTLRSCGVNGPFGHDVTLEFDEAGDISTVTFAKNCHFWGSQAWPVLKRK